jgi:hypothetical protein
MTPLLKRRLFIAGGIFAALAVFGLVDTPATVRTKSLIINLLPLDAQTKLDSVENLCKAAYAGSAGAGDCYAVNYSQAAAEEIGERRDEARRQQRCADYRKRMMSGDLKSDWRPSDDSKAYYYVGSDPDMKGWALFIDECMVLTSDGFKSFKP